jgi:hypothetical protein
MRGIGALALASMIIGLSSCGTQQNSTKGDLEANSAYEMAMEENPAMKGFDKKNSDENAIAIADEVMKAMGGRKNWDNTRYISWNFFGRRSLLWDKWENRVRIDYANEDVSLLVNTDQLTGQVWKNGQEVTNPEEKENFLKKGKSTWINDSYWLVMPFKLKDTGVTLKHIKEKFNDSTGNMEDILELTFKNVGDTPENKYRITVDQESNMVTSWAFYQDASQQEPNFITPWKDYQKYGKILLSGDRGKYQLSDIQVYVSLPEDAWDLSKKMSE